MAPRVERKLAAILALDVVGYSRLIVSTSGGPGLERCLAGGQEGVAQALPVRHAHLLALLHQAQGGV